MELYEQALHFCAHIKTLTHVHCGLLDGKQERFCADTCPFHDGLACRSCDMIGTHLQGSREAQRWDGKYIYLCPENLVFSAVNLRQNGVPTRYSLITGPFSMTEEEEPNSPGNGVALLTTRQARSLNEIIYAVAGYLTGAPVAPDVDSGRQAAVLQTLYDLSSLPSGERYPVEAERQLQESIRRGDRADAQDVLNRLVCRFYAVSDYDLEGLKSYVRVLMVLMSRGAIKGGADMNEVFSYSYRCEKEMETYRDYESLSIWLSGIMQRFVGFMFDLTAVKHQSVIREVTAMIQDNLSEKLTLEQAADRVYLSKSYFCRIFRQELGCTFTEYVNSLRVEESKKQLAETGLPVATVAANTGFEDQGYFARVFKKLVGMSPKQYRESRKIE